MNSKHEKYTDWQVTLSKYTEIVDVKPIRFDASKTRFKPVYLENEDLTIIIPAKSVEEAKEKAANIARHILSTGAWGIEVWNLTEFLASIEKLL